MAARVYGSNPPSPGVNVTTQTWKGFCRQKEKGVGVEVEEVWGGEGDQGSDLMESADVVSASHSGENTETGRSARHPPTF